MTDTDYHAIAAKLRERDMWALADALDALGGEKA